MSPPEQIRWEKCPLKFKYGLKRYFEHGIEPGHFLTAVLKGDLFEAMRRADPESVLQLFRLCVFLESEFPSICYGNTERVLNWMSVQRARFLNQSQEIKQDANT